jgi:hypothetical protein
MHDYRERKVYENKNIQTITGNKNVLKDSLLPYCRLDNLICMRDNNEDTI